MVVRHRHGYAGRMQKPREVTVTEVGRSPGVALPAQPLGAGDLLGGRYRIRRFVAAGGMGEVYEADDQLLGDPVAVKLLRTDLIRTMRLLGCPTINSLDRTSIDVPRQFRDVN